jgi:hypothetical protein
VIGPWVDAAVVGVVEVVRGAAVDDVVVPPAVARVTVEGAGMEWCLLEVVCPLEVVGADALGPSARRLARP